MPLVPWHRHVDQIVASLQWLNIWCCKFTKCQVVVWAAEDVAHLWHLSRLWACVLVSVVPVSVCLGAVETASFAARLLSVNAVACDLLAGYSSPLLSDTLHNRLHWAVSCQTCCIQQGIAPSIAVRSKNRSGSTSIHRRVRTSHICGGRRWLSCRQPACL